jgi:hypothetical protein
VFGRHLLADDCVQGGMHTVLVWLRLVCERPSGRIKNRVIMNDGQQLLHQAIPVVGISLPMILVVKRGTSPITN